jgi:hypothetical protein
MSSSLNGGLVVVVRRIGHCVHRTSLSLISVEIVVHERKVNRKDEQYHRIVVAARRMNPEC